VPVSGVGVNRSQTAPIPSAVEETKSRVGGDLREKYDQVVKDFADYKGNMVNKVPVLLEAVRNGMIPTTVGDPDHFIITQGSGIMCKPNSTVAMYYYVFDINGQERYGSRGMANSKAKQVMGTNSITMFNSPCKYLETCLGKMSLGERALFRTDSSIFDLIILTGMGLT